MTILQSALLSAEKSYTFSDYFKLGLDARDAVRFHGYAFRAGYLNLPTRPVDPQIITPLREQLIAVRPLISLNNEMARREFLMAPILTRLLIATQAEARTEYPIHINQQLRGTLDYWLEGANRVVIIEAKRADLELGFTQLAVELIAIDQMPQLSQASILGAVSIGDVWQFGVLDRQNKHLTQDLQFYTIPDDLEQVLGILSAELTEISDSHAPHNLNDSVS